MAASDLTDLATVKAYIFHGNATPPTTDDPLLTRLISAASEYIYSSLKTVVTSATYTEVRDGHGGQKMMFANIPATAVSSLKINGTVIPAAVGQGAGYIFTENLIAVRGYQFSRGIGNVEISYTAGYTTVPADIVQCCVELVALRYQERKRTGQVSLNIDGQTVTFSQRDEPAAVTSVLNAYRKVIPV